MKRLKILYRYGFYRIAQIKHFWFPGHWYRIYETSAFILKKTFANSLSTLEFKFLYKPHLSDLLLYMMS